MNTTTSKQSTISQGDMTDIVTALEIVQANGGHGKVEIDLEGSQVISIKTSVTKPIHPSTPLSDDIARWPRFTITPVRDAPPAT